MPNKCHKKTVMLMAWNIANSMFHFGYCLLYITQIPIKTLKDIYSIPLGEGVTLGILNGCIPIGGLVGSLSSSFFISRFSRRQNMLICNAFMFLAFWLIFVQNFPMLIICRFCQGIGVGFFTSLAPLIVNEIAPVELSGAIGTYAEINLNLGVFIGCIFPYSLLKITGDDSGRAYWFLVFGLPLAIITIQTLLLLFVFPHETPKYHLLVGQEEEAKKVIAILYKPEFVEEILKLKKIDLHHDEYQQKEQIPGTQVSLSNIVSQRQLDIHQKRKTPRQAVLVSVHLSALQQLSGINIVSIYAVSISAQIITGQLNLIMPSIINVVGFISAIISYFLFANFGRRPILFYGTLGETIANILITIGYFIKDTHKGGETLILVGVFIFIISFGLSVGPIVWLYISQIVQPEVMPLSMSVNWVSSSIVLILFPILTQDFLNNNPAYLFVFSTVWCVLSLIINHFYVIETKGKAEKTIREEFKAMHIC